MFLPAVVAALANRMDAGLDVHRVVPGADGEELACLGNRRA
jgi:hypothetical protein